MKSGSIFEGELLVYLTEYQRNFELEKTYWWFIGVRRMVKTLIALCNPRRGPLKILDIGCGTGALMDDLTAQGHNVWGLDISQEALKFCRMHLLFPLAMEHARRGQRAQT